MIAIRDARQNELAELEHIVRLAFATHLGLPSPEAFGDRALIGPRWRADPRSVLVAELDGRAVGSNVATLWGRFGWFGPLTVHPDYWNRGIAQALLAPTMRRFAEHRTAAEALFTFSSSPKHITLYQRYDFWPRRLTAVMARTPARSGASYRRLSSLAATARDGARSAIARITNGLFAGLDLALEIEAVATQGTGETLLVEDDGGVAGFAVCHHGPGSEAGSNDCAVKFGAAATGAAFRSLLVALLDYSAEVGAQRAAVSINTARERAYRSALEAGFTIAMLGVAMVRGDAAYDHPDAWVLEDHR